MVKIKIQVHLECAADAAWRGLHSPAVAERLYLPLLRMKPQNGGSFPAQFSSGTSIEVKLLLFQVITVGSQRIMIEDLVMKDQGSGGLRTMRDAGRPLSGPLALVNSWNHEITVGPAGNERTLWSDELTVGGWFAPFAALILWPMWHWRGAKLKRISRDWKFES